MSRFLTTHKNWKKMQDYARYAYDKWKAEIGGMAVMVEKGQTYYQLMNQRVRKKNLLFAHFLIFHYQKLML